MDGFKSGERVLSHNNSNFMESMHNMSGVSQGGRNSQVTFKTDNPKQSMVSDVKSSSAVGITSKGTSPPAIGVPEMSKGKKGFNKASALADKLKTRMDLLFIRQMRESGYNICIDPSINMNLLYDYEREKLFKEKEDKVEKVKKKGPRQILNPDLATLEFKVDMGFQKYDA